MPEPSLVIIRPNHMYSFENSSSPLLSGSYNGRFWQTPRQRLPRDHFYKREKVCVWVHQQRSINPKILSSISRLCSRPVMFY